MIRTYSELKRLETFEERFDYLKLVGSVGRTTFGYDRHLNQTLYHSTEWMNVRDSIIVRDMGCDLGIIGFEIFETVVVHHINPITIDDVLSNNEILFNPEFLITTSHRTHMAIHYGNENGLKKAFVERFPGDTNLW